jgi:hypothetical protein
MACPYFYPVAPARAAGAGAAMLPLGDQWTGICRAAPDSPWRPGEATLRPLCNLGYARGACARFPAGDGPDAVRFTVRAASDAAVHLYYVVERDHHPFAHGALDYSPASKSLVAPPPGENLNRQAQAYAESYLERMEHKWKANP